MQVLEEIKNYLMNSNTIFANSVTIGFLDNDNTNAILESNGFVIILNANNEQLFSNIAFKEIVNNQLFIKNLQKIELNFSIIILSTINYNFNTNTNINILDDLQIKNKINTALTNCDIVNNSFVNRLSYLSTNGQWVNKTYLEQGSRVHRWDLSVYCIYEYSSSAISQNINSIDLSLISN